MSRRTSFVLELLRFAFAADRSRQVREGDFERERKQEVADPPSRATVAFIFRALSENPRTVLEPQYIYAHDESVEQ